MATEPISDEDIWELWRANKGDALDFARAILRLAAERAIDACEDVGYLHPGGYSAGVGAAITEIRRVLTGGGE